MRRHTARKILPHICSFLDLPPGTLAPPMLLKARAMSSPRRQFSIVLSALGLAVALTPLRRSGALSTCWLRGPGSHPTTLIEILISNYQPRPNRQQQAFFAASQAQVQKRIKGAFTSVQHCEQEHQACQSHGGPASVARPQPHGRHCGRMSDYVG